MAQLHPCDARQFSSPIRFKPTDRAYVLPGKTQAWYLDNGQVTLDARTAKGQTQPASVTALRSLLEPLAIFMSATALLEAFAPNHPELQRPAWATENSIYTALLQLIQQQRIRLCRWPHAKSIKQGGRSAYQPNPMYSLEDLNQLGMTSAELDAQRKVVLAAQQVYDVAKDVKAGKLPLDNVPLEVLDAEIAAVGKALIESLKDWHLTEPLSMVLPNLSDSDSQISPTVTGTIDPVPFNDYTDTIGGSVFNSVFGGPLTNIADMKRRLTGEQDKLGMNPLTDQYEERSRVDSFMDWIPIPAATTQKAVVKAVGGLAEGLPKVVPDKVSGFSISSSKQNLRAVAAGIEELTPAQARVLSNLDSGFGAETTIHKKGFGNNDLAALSAATGDEFAMFTTGGRRLIVRGDAGGVPISTLNGSAQRLADRGWRFSSHVHPDGSLMSSVGDRNVLSVFPNSKSAVLDPYGGRGLFNSNGDMISSGWLPK